MTPEIRAFLTAPDPLIVTKANVEIARPPARLHGLCRRQALRRDGKVAGELRIVGLFTSDGLHALGRRRIPLIRREGRRHPDARRLRSAQPFRQGAPQHPGELSAHRAVPGRRGRALRCRPWRSCSWRSGRACARSPAATASTASSPCSSSCRATATPPTCASGSALALAELYDGRVSAFFPDFSHDAPDARAVHHRPQSGRGPGPGAGRDRGAHPRHRPHLRGRSRRGAERRLSAGPRRRRCCRDYAGAFGSDYRAAFTAADARRRHRDRRAARRRTTSRRASSGGRACRRREVVLQLPPSRRRRSRCRGACRSWRISASRSSTSAPTASPGERRRTLYRPRHDAGASRRRRPSTSAAARAAARRRASPSGATGRRTTASTRWCSLAGLDWRRGGAAAHASPLSAADRTFPIRSTISGARCSAIPRVAALLVERFAARFDPDVKQRERRRGARSTRRSRRRWRR